MLPADSPFASPPAPGPHPGPAELRAYAAGTLPPADEHRIEAHTLDCARCAELLEGFSMSDAATTDQALATLRTRLQARVADSPAAPVLLPASRPLWPRLAAAVALLGAAGAGLWGGQHYEPAPAPTARVETAAPAAPAVASSEPATSVAAITAPQAESAAARPPKPAGSPVAAAARKPDYAAVAPARRKPSRRRFEQPSAPPVAMMRQAPEAAATTPAVVADALRNEPAPTSAATVPGPPGEPARAARPAPDTVQSLGEVAVAMRAVKAKAAQPSPAALVANTPMPAAVAIAPAPVTGTPALRDYLRREAAKFEPEEGAKPLNGTVRLRFVVEADGQLSNLRVVRGIRADYDEAALRMMCEGPAWRPGIAGGRRAALPVEMTVSF